MSALAVKRSDRMVAALPLAGRRSGGLLPVADLTANYWSPNGELLLDESDDAPAALDLLAAALDDLPWPLVWLDLVPVEAPRWRMLAAALARRGLAVDLHRRYRTCSGCPSVCRPRRARPVGRRARRLALKCPLQ